MIIVLGPHGCIHEHPSCMLCVEGWKAARLIKCATVCNAAAPPLACVSDMPAALICLPCIRVRVIIRVRVRARANKSPANLLVWRIQTISAVWLIKMPA